MSKQPLRHTGENDAFPDVENVSSATECTGLMPAMVYSEEETEELARMEGIHPFPPQNRQK
ncbi:MAG: hypothetical protein IJO67_01650 [Clostridia bacterium]|nr:hypothetical protein [Clostridia bacterium]MBR2055259.1 hypothetical protein [Clostridia bacterium]MBR6753642.1 hypothetical protein [Clostridia bacterium]